MSQSESTIEERIRALREHHGVLLTKAAERFTGGCTALAASDTADASKIAKTLAEMDRQLGNLCASHRLLEWKPQR